MSSRLESIPAELLSHVVSYISRPSDLRSLCLTSKTLRVPATERLYFALCLRSDVLSSHDLDTGLLSATNPGLELVRRLRFVPDDYDCVTPEEIATMKAVLQRLPTNVLRELSCGSFPIDEECAFMILERQQNIEAISLGPLTFNMVPIIQSASLAVKMLETIKDLEVPKYIDSRLDLEAYQTMIERCPLSSLIIRTQHSRDGRDSNLNDSQETDGLIFRTLFSHIRASEAIQLLKVTELALEVVSLQHSKRTLSRYVDFSVLKYLDLYECSGADAFICSLTEHFKLHGGGQLKRFSFEGCGKEKMKAWVFEEFLNSFVGLELLLIFTWRFDRPLNFKCLDQHADTLTHLAYHPETKRPLSIALPQDLFSTISMKCRKLREVAVPLPRIQLPSQDSMAVSEAYERSLAALFDLPDLKTLRIYNFPTPKDGFLSGISNDETVARLNVAAYLQSLDNFVCSMLSSILNINREGATSPVLCFSLNCGRRISFGGIALDIASACYVPIRQRDVFGATQSVFHRIPEVDVKYFEPECLLLKWPYQL